MMIANCGNARLMLLAAVALWPVYGTPCETAGAGSVVASLTDEDAALIAWTARRAVEAEGSGQPAPINAYRPMSMRGLTARIHVTLRRSGRIVGDAESGETDLLEGTVAAAIQAARAAATHAAFDIQGQADPLGLEVEVIGPPDYLTAGLDADLHFEPELYSSFEPGIEGVGVELNGRRGLTRPSVILAANYTPTLALQHAEKEAGFTAATKQAHKSAIRYFRFRTLHVWQRDAFSPPVRLKRGVTVIDVAAVTRAALDDAIQSLTEYVLARCRRDAWFAFDYVPSSERFSERNSLFGQFEAAWSLGSYGRSGGCARCVDAASRVLAAAQSFVVPFDDKLPLRAIISTKDASPLATTGLYLAGMSRCRSPEIKLAPEHIADALRAVQKDNGRFETTFPPDPPVEGQAYAAGAALVGLLDYAEGREDPLVDRALRQAVRFYRRYFRA
ncbi:MAG: AMMECR1 domain-containing protein, partial [Phycisphaerae bacterium]